MKNHKMKFEKKMGFSEIFAFFALLLSVVAILQSHKAKNDLRILNKIDFRPKIALRARLEKISNQIPAHINIINRGPVDAIQVQIQFYFHKYFPKQQKVRASATGSDLQWIIDKLTPLKPKNILINESSLNDLLPAFSDNEKHYRILEIRLNYRREVGLKEYSESAFYFVSPEGKWVSEASSALNSEIYKPIKEAAFSRFTVKSDMLNHSDILHELSE
jgi:hypothetical protein